MFQNSNICRLLSCSCEYLRPNLIVPEDLYEERVPGPIKCMPLFREIQSPILRLIKLSKPDHLKVFVQIGKININCPVRHETSEPDFSTPGAFRRIDLANHSSPLTSLLMHSREHSDPNSELFILQGADLNFSPLRSAHTLNFLPNLVFNEDDLLVERLEFLIKNGLMDFAAYNSNGLQESPLIFLISAFGSPLYMKTVRENELNLENHGYG